MISYAPLFKTMKRKGVTGYKLVQMGIPSSTYHSIRRGNGMTIKTLNSLCSYLECGVSDIIEYIDDKKDKK